MKMICLILLLVFQYCSNPENKSNKNDTILNIDSAGSNTDSSWQFIAPEIIDTLPVYATLKINPRSLDSIMAYVVFSNNSNKKIWLYKPILPIDSLTESTFSIHDENDLKLPFNKTRNDFKYYSKENSPVRLIIPEIEKNGLVGLSSGDSISFTINLAKYYDFRAEKKKGMKSFVIEYSYLFPFIENGKHVFRVNENFNSSQPVYISMFSSKSILDAFQKKIKLPDN